MAVSGANDATRVSGTLKLVSPNAFSIDQKAVYEVRTITTGTITAYDNNLTISDGVTSVVLPTSVTTPLADMDALVAAIQAGTNYGDLKFAIDKAANGTDLEFTYKAAGANYQVDTWVPGGYGASHAVTIDNGDASVANLTLGAASHANATALVTAIKADGDYAAQNYTVYVSGTSIEFIYKTEGAQTKPTVTYNGANAVTTSATKAAGPGRITYDVAGGTITNEAVALKTAGVNSLGYYTENTAAANLKNLTEINVSTMVAAGDSISIMDAALDKVAQMRSDLGAIENRLGYTVSNLMNIAEKTADARSRLDDADFALESARLAKAQVIQQAGTSMLAQANQLTQLVLELLR